MTVSTMWVIGLLLSAALVAGRSGVGPGEQDWNYVDVRPGAHMFYWLYQTTAQVADPTSRPLVIWLQGGPGASSMFGNFEEFGIVDLDLKARNISWVHHVNVLFIDNPVGTGWSYVDNLNLLTQNNLEVATDLVTFMTGFYEQHPEFSNSDLYIFCESYGGKMAPEFALELYKAIQAGKSKAPLKGVGLGDPWTSPIDSVLTWAPFLLETGMVDDIGYKTILDSAKKCESALISGQYELATDLWGYTENVILDVTSNIDFYNILYKVPPMFRAKNNMSPRDFLYQQQVGEPKIALEDLMEGPVRDVLGDVIPPQVRFGNQDGAVFDGLYEDFMKPATDIVEQLLNDTDLTVAVISGQLDLIVDTPGTLDWVNRLKWSGAKSWKAANRNPLAVNNIIEGYTKKLQNFGFYWILRAGHMVPADNPVGALKMLQEITKYDTKH